MTDPKPQHPVARAIWDALERSEISDPRDLCSSDGFAEEWDRVAREAEARDFMENVLEAPELSPKDWVNRDKVNAWLDRRWREYFAQRESAHRREGGEKSPKPRPSGGYWDEEWGPGLRPE